MTIFPPYFVAGAIFAGFAMVVMVLVVVRETMQLKNLITMRHLEMMNKVILGMACLMGYAYIDGGLHGLVLHEPVHPPHLHELRLRDLRLGRLADHHLQHLHPPAALVPQVPHQLLLDDLRVHRRDRRHVVRALRASS